MPEIRIEKAVPIPTDIRSGRRPKYPFAKMKIGDSFWLPEPEGRQAVEAANKFYQRNPDFCLITRMEGEGRRIWRVKNAPNRSQDRF